MAQPLTCTREAVKRRLDVKLTAYADAEVDDAIAAGTQSVERLLHRVFYPWTGTRYFDWPNAGSPTSYRLWLNADELASVTTLVAGGVTIAATDYLLEPINSGPPYNRLEIDLSSSAALAAGDTHQRAIAITGVWAGCPLDTDPAGALSGGINDSTTTAVVTNSALAEVGHILLCGTERMIVTERGMADTGADLAAPDLTASAANTSVTVTDGTKVKQRETILIDSERMWVVDVAGNTLTVKRAYDGSVLSAHTAGASVYAPRSLTVTRGALGTTAAAHLDAAALTRHAWPALARRLTIAEALCTMLGEEAGWAAYVGNGDSRRATATTIGDLRAETKRAIGRNCRMRAV
jgi:hypothetical protein